MRDALGMVTQDGHLFHDTIRANLLLARPDATEDELWDVLRRARLADLIRSLPDGLDTVVGERGYRLSGGERQRLTIARLLLARPRVVILDEATAHLDSTSEAAVQEALGEALDRADRVVIAHRLSTIRAADQILVRRGRAGSWSAARTPSCWPPAAGTPSCTAPSSTNRCRPDVSPVVARPAPPGSGCAVTGRGLRPPHRVGPLSADRATGGSPGSRRRSPPRPAGGSRSSGRTRATA